MVRIILVIIAGAQPPIIAWLGGVDLTVRSMDLSATYILSVILVAMALLITDKSVSNK